MKTFYCRFMGQDAWDPVNVDDGTNEELAAVEFLDKCCAHSLPLGKYSIEVRIEDSESFRTHGVSVVESGRHARYGPITFF